MNKRVPIERADERVWELLYLRSQDRITPARFVRLVNIVEMRPGEHAPHPFEGYLPGTFDIIKQGFADGVISHDEYTAIAREEPLLYGE